MITHRKAATRTDVWNAFWASAAVACGPSTGSRRSCRMKRSARLRGAPSGGGSQSVYSVGAFIAPGNGTTG